MKMTKKLLPASVAATVLASATLFSATATAGETEVGASVAISNLYLFRGEDVGGGDAAVSGDLVVSNGGFYAGIWATSGDRGEYDLFAGYATEFGGLGVDLSVWNYVFPSSPDGSDDAVGDFTEIILGLSYGPVNFGYVDNIAGNSGYEYYTLGVEQGAFGLTVGFADEEDGNDYTHVDLTYAFNDNLSFTWSQVVDQDDDEDDPDGVDEDGKFVVTYSLPIDL